MPDISPGRYVNSSPLSMLMKNQGLAWNYHQSVPRMKCTVDLERIIG
jgi:hypothetical protein